MNQFFDSSRIDAVVDGDVELKDQLFTMMLDLMGRTLPKLDALCDEGGKAGWKQHMS